MGDKKSKTQSLNSKTDKKELRILMLEDNPADAELIEQKLAEGGIVFLSKRVDTREDFVKELKDFTPDIILADYSLPSFDGLSALSIAQETCPDLPVIIVSGVIGEYLAIETLKKGATDYVLKDRLSRLVPAVNRALQETKKQLERRKLEEALQRSEKHFRSLIENALDIILILGRDGSIRYGSPSIERVLGYVPEDFLNKNVFEFVHPDDVPKLSGIFARGIQIPDYIVSVEFRVRHKNGSWYFGEGIGRNLLHDPAVKGVIVNFRDITERKQAEEKLNHLLEILRKAKEEWEMTFDNVMELIVIIDKDLRIIRCNKSFAEFAGMPINELTGKKCYDFFSCDYKQIGNCRVRSQTEEIARKNEIKTESGRWFYESNCPILDEKRNFLYSVVVATDITELKTSQQGFIQAQEELKNRIKELEDFYDMAVGREMRMIELKNEIEDLKAELSKHKKDELV